MKLPRALSSLFADPPPAYAFELSEAGIASAAAASLPRLDFHPLPPETISVSPLRDNVLVPDRIAAVAPVEIIARYEAPFRAMGLTPGLVTTSALAMLRLVHTRKLAVVAKLSGRVLTLLVVDAGLLKLVRCLELARRDLAEVAADLFPTFVFVEDQFGRKAEELLLAGFGDLAEPARRDFQPELGLPVSNLESRIGAPGEFNAGLVGYVQGAMERP